MPSTSDNVLVGAIEAGGTKFVCAVGSCLDDLEEVRIPTRDPETTLAEAAAFFEAQAQSRGELAALGIGTFGPADIDPTSPGFGSILSTPKPGWSGADFLAPLRAALGSGLPFAFDTDVNAAAIGERRWGAGRGIDDLVYITVGTGIGGGVISNGAIVHGHGHPEIGHLRIPHDLTADPFEGCCPFHGDCLEGLASGTALRERWGVPAEDLPEDHAAWSLEARYLADAVLNLAMTVSPSKAILGGGVMESGILLPLVRDEVQRRLAGYLSLPSEGDWIVQPTLGNRAGIAGAMSMALEVASRV